MTTPMNDIAAALLTTTPNGHARTAALAAAARVETQPTSIVSYQSKGSVVIVGPAASALAAAERLQARLACTVVVTDEDDAPQHTDGARSASMPVVREKPLQVIGHLGQFSVIVAAPPPLGGVNLVQKLGRSAGFDLVLDLSTPPFLHQELRPFGYYAPNDAAALEQTLAELPDMVGEFEKPKFFHYDPAICAHGRNGLSGCTRCLDACPASAIISMGDEIAVDPYLCQGAGACASACPTGAISYVYPRLSDHLTKISTLLKTYRGDGGALPVVLFHDAELGRTRLAARAKRLPENVLPVEVAEIGAVGMDTWLAALAYGAAEVWLLMTAATPNSVRAEIGAQLAYARAILAGMGYRGECLRLIDAEVVSPFDARVSARTTPPAAFAGLDEKRSVLRLAIEHLYEHAPAARAETALPAGAPFGEIQVDRDACTLCMACVATCPAGALADGGDLPQLNFIEANCVQCGLCQSTCPEQAITLRARYLYDSEKRRANRVLNEETPFYCVRCGKPFATRKMMDTMTAKLKGHWMFETTEALQRVRMCGDCRVRDVFQAKAKRPGDNLGL